MQKTTPNVGGVFLILVDGVGLVVVHRVSATLHKKCRLPSRISSFFVQFNASFKLMLFHKIRRWNILIFLGETWLVNYKWYLAKGENYICVNLGFSKWFEVNSVMGVKSFKLLFCTFFPELSLTGLFYGRQFSVADLHSTFQEKSDR